MGNYKGGAEGRRFPLTPPIRKGWPRSGSSGTSSSMTAPIPNASTSYPDGLVGSTKGCRPRGRSERGSATYLSSPFLRGGWRVRTRGPVWKLAGPASCGLSHPSVSTVTLYAILLASCSGWVIYMGIPYQCCLTLARGGLGRGVRVSICGGGWLHVFALATPFFVIPSGGMIRG